MTEHKPIFGFTAGEISPDFYGRTDITKYDLALKLAQNFIVDYRGGLKSRGGFEYLAPIPGAFSATKKFRFRSTGNDYIVEFSNNLIRFMRNGGYLVETAKTITSISADTFTVTSHGFSDGDLVYVADAVEFSNRYFEIYSSTTNTFRVRMVDDPALDTTGYTAYTSGGTVARVVTTTSTYTSAELSDLRFEQLYEECYLTHPDHAPAVLTRVSDTNWTLADLDMNTRVAKPIGVSLAASSSGSAGIAAVVTAVVGGEEGLPSDYAFITNSVDYTTTAGELVISWAQVDGATEYYVYRSLVLTSGSNISHAQDVGYIGRTKGVQFVDRNISPDFTKTPPEFFNPFAASTITEIKVTAGGSGYSNTSTITVTDANGSGFVGFPVVNSSGALASIIVINGGAGYTSPSVSVSGGSGATFTVSLGPASGTFPALFRVFQQRGVYAGTANEPMRIWASRPNQLRNFDVSSQVTAADGYSYELDSREVRPIKHMLSLRTGLLLFTSENITLLRAEEGKAVTALNALAEPQAYQGANDAEPIGINLDVLFAERGAAAVNAMMYTEYTNSFAMQDVAVLANHLVTEGKEITRMFWQKAPHKLVWCLREDGALLSLTYEREQEVFGWAQHSTQGLFRDILVIEEDGKEILYATVVRYVRGRWRRFTERLALRDVEHVEDYFGVDCGLRTTLNYPDLTLTVTENPDLETVTLEATGIFLTAGVGDHFFFGNGRYVITNVLTDDIASATYVRLPDDNLHVSNRFRYYQSGTWHWGTPTSTFSNLWHLEGETVSINIDGDAFLNRTVANGELSFDVPVVKASIGLQYHCDAETLPPVFAGQALEAVSKSILGGSVRLRKTRGLSFGTSEADLVEMKDRTDEAYGEVLRMRNDFNEILVGSAWSNIGTLYFRQAYPLPAHILSLDLELDLGD